MSSFSDNMESDVKSVILEKLAEISDRAEILRADAVSLEEEHHAISVALEALTWTPQFNDIKLDDRAELIEQVERITSRINGVSVTIEISRSSPQEDSLSTVNDLIDTIVKESKKDVMIAKSHCLRFLNTCRSGEDDCPTDSVFESALLGCALDDQKRIFKRLCGLLHYLNHATLKD